MNLAEERVLASIDREEIISFMRALIQARSDYPPGDTRRMAQLCKEKLEAYGIEAETVVPPDTVVSPKNDGVDNCTKPSVIGKIQGEPGPTLLLNAHIDTVPAGDLSQWKYDPFEGVVEDGMIYGRGAGDDKGSVLAQIMAACALKKANIPLKGTLLINPVADEEAHSWRGARWLRDSGILKPDLALIGEQTDNEVAVGERSICFYNVKIQGKAAHGAMPWAGNNATIHMSRFIMEVNEKLVPELQANKPPYLPATTLATTRIKGGSLTNIIPEECVLGIDCRMTPNITKEHVKKRLEELLEELSRDAKQPFEWSVEITNNDIGVYTDAGHPLVQTLLGALKEVRGKEAEPTGYYQHSDGSRFAKLGIPIAIFGPGDPRLGHSPNECVSIDQLMEATRTLAVAVMRLMAPGE